MAGSGWSISDKRTKMILISRMVMMLCALSLGSGAWLGLVASAQAATIIDTYEVTLTGKQWCEGNPTFSEPFKVAVNPRQPAQSTTLTLTQDPQNSGDRAHLHAVLNTQGASLDLDGIALEGRAFPSTKTGGSAQIVLSGSSPANPDHSLTMRGQAKFDKAGRLLSVSGTYVFQAISTYTTDKKTGAQSGPVDCFNSGTVATKGKALIQGTFIDRPVDGVRYTTASNPVGGYTSGGGHYLCHLGETVTFFLGTRQLGVSQPCTEVVTVASLLRATSLTDPQVVNLAQLLMTLDSQVSPDVITIPVPLPGGVSPANIPPFTDPNFDTNVLAALPGGTVLVTEATALAQLQQALKQVTVTGMPQTTVTSTPAGINCINGAGICSTYLPTGTVVTLTAMGAGFTGWNGSGCSGTGPCVLTLTVDTAVALIGDGGNEGTIRVTGAPAIVGGTFVSNPQYTVRSLGSIFWSEVSAGYTEVLAVGYVPGTTQVGWMYFQSVTVNPTTGTTWGCNPFFSPNCLGAPIAGATFNSTAGRLTLNNVVLQNAASGLSVTLNGTLRFTPF